MHLCTRAPLHPYFSYHLIYVIFFKQQGEDDREMLVWDFHAKMRRKNFLSKSREIIWYSEFLAITLQAEREKL